MWFFGKKRKEEPASAPTIRRFDNILEIRSLGFAGQCCVSPNERYTLAWADFDRSAGRGGNRESGRGRYILIECDNPIVDGELERPHDGKVSNGGTFVLNDWLFTQALVGSFYAFGKNGDLLLKQRFQANLYNNGLADDGRYAVCQLANSDSSDGGTLAFFDLVGGKLLWQISPKTGCADYYEFDSRSELLYLGYRELGAFKYGFAGEFLDSERWGRSQIEHGDAFAIYSIAKDKIQCAEGAFSPGTASEVFEMLDVAFDRSRQYPYQQAAIQRTKGEVHEALREPRKALLCYEEALRIDPKVGVKRKITALRKAGA
jgi:hypothetical protein